MQVRRCTKCMGELKEGVQLCPYCSYEQDSTVQPGIALKRNTILHGRYLIGNVIGQGGFGITYVGWDLTLEMKVAVKEYFPSGSATRTNSISNEIEWDSINGESENRPDGMERFLKEARKMARLDEVPSIVRVRDAFGENQTAYIVMDFVEGVTLKKYLLSHGVLGYEECMSLLSPVLDSLAVIHDRGFIHRDISPDNIMLRPDGSARLLDMGAAVDVNASGGHASMAVVKRNFSAPEQYMESETLGSWTDVYAMGATIYYCMTGKVVPEALEREFKKAPLYFDPGLNIPLHVIRALNAALELRAENRIRDMREFKRSLTDVGDGRDDGDVGEPELQKMPEPGPQPGFQQIPPTAPFMGNGDEMKTTPYTGEPVEQQNASAEETFSGKKEPVRVEMKQPILKKGWRTALIIIGALFVVGIPAVKFYQAQSAQHAEYVKRSQVFQKLWETADSFEADDQLNASLESCNSALTAMDFGKVTVDEVLVAKDAAGDKMGYVIVSHSDDSFTGIVKIAVGLKENGTVNGIEFLEINDTPNLGLKAVEPDFKDQYAGQSGVPLSVVKYERPGDNEIKAVSGATITSEAVTNAVNAAMFFGQNYVAISGPVGYEGCGAVGVSL